MKINYPKPSTDGFIPLYAAFAVFIVAAAAYGGLFFVNRAQMQTRQQLIDEITTKQDDLRPRVLDEIFAFDERLKRIGSVLSQHPIPSMIFAFLEETTHPRARFSNLNFSREGMRLTMSGETDSYATLARQIAFFEGDLNVTRLEFGGLTRNQNGSVRFTINIMFAPSFINNRS